MKRRKNTKEWHGASDAEERSRHLLKTERSAEQGRTVMGALAVASSTFGPFFLSDIEVLFLGKRACIRVQS